jgi:hypothetical protein
MADAPSSQRCLIQLDRPGEKLDMSAVRALLEDTQVQLDPTYGPILINPKLGRYVVRGTVTPDQRHRLERLPFVRVFADAPVHPTAR